MLLVRPIIRTQYGVQKNDLKPKQADISHFSLAESDLKTSRINVGLHYKIAP